MPKETIGRRAVRKPAEPKLLPQKSAPSWRLKRLSQLTAQDPTLWGIAWALLWRIMVLLFIFRTIIIIVRTVLYGLANIS